MTWRLSDLDLLINQQSYEHGANIRFTEKQSVAASGRQDSVTTASDLASEFMGSILRATFLRC